VISIYREFANAILQASVQDVEWHKDNPDKELSKAYQKGFIKGIEQVYRYLIPPILDKFEKETKEQINGVDPKKG